MSELMNVISGESTALRMRTHTPVLLIGAFPGFKGARFGAQEMEDSPSFGCRCRLMSPRYVYLPEPPSQETNLQYNYIRDACFT